MSVNTVADLISKIGVPSAMLIILFYGVWKVGGKVLVMYEKHIEKLEEINIKSIEAINNNTRIMEAVYREMTGTSSDKELERLNSYGYDERKD